MSEITTNPYDSILSYREINGFSSINCYQIVTYLTFLFSIIFFTLFELPLFELWLQVMIDNNKFK
jgi:hypothetical protein